AGVGGVGGGGQARCMAGEIGAARGLIGQGEGVSVHEFSRYTKFEVQGRTFGYLWEPTSTVGLKQTMAEQAALVGERPEVFEVQFNAGGVGWGGGHPGGGQGGGLAGGGGGAGGSSAPRARVGA